MTTPNKSEGAEWEQRFVEEGAALEHERWAGWQKHLHGKLEFNGKDWVLRNEWYERWNGQIHTPYSELSEAEKESDRREARTYLPMVAHQRQQAVAEFAREVVAALERDCDHPGCLQTGCLVRSANYETARIVHTLLEQRGIEL